MLVALRVIGVYASGVDLEADFRSGGVFRIKTERSRERIEAARQPAEAQVLDPEVDRRVRAFRIDDVVSRIGGAGQQANGKHGGKERFHIVHVSSLEFSWGSIWGLCCDLRGGGSIRRSEPPPSI